jgi:hypothetical protein
MKPVFHTILASKEIADTIIHYISVIVLLWSYKGLFRIYEKREITELSVKLRKGKDKFTSENIKPLKMPNIHHEVLIEAPIEKVYNAIINQEGLSAWWTPGTSAKAEVGSIARFPFGPKYPERAGHIPTSIA